MTTDVLMSIRPRFADAILAGSKTFELRRRRPSFGPGTTVLIYVSSPKQRVAGRFVSGDILAADPDRLWREVNASAGVSREEFDSYFAGCKVAYAIEVRDAQPIKPTTLPFRPPQSWQYLRSGDRRHRSLIDRAARPQLA